MLAGRGRDEELVGIGALALQTGPGERLGEYTELLQVGIRFIEVSFQGAWLVFYQPQDAVEGVNQRSWVAIVVGQPQRGVLGALGEVAEPVLALLFLDQSAACRR